MRFLRTNTAVIITVGPFYDKTDGVTIETALTITNERITLTADTDAGSAPTNILDNVTGATSGTANDLNYITGNDAGMMQLELAAADTNRLGRMFLSITDAANHVPVFHEFMVLPAMIYDAFILGTDVLDSSMTQILGTAVSTPATAGILDVNVKNIDNDAASASGTVTFPNATLASTANITAGTITTVTTLTGHTPQTGDAYARLGAPAGASVSADVAAVKADTAAVKVKTDFLPSATAGAAGGVFIAGTNAATTITTALTTTFTGSLTGSVASVTGAVGSVTGLTAATVHSDLDDIQTRLPAALVGGRMDASAGAIAANVITAAATAADFTTEIQAGLATSASLTTAQADLDDIQTRLPVALVGGRMDSSVGAVAAGTLAQAAFSSEIGVSLFILGSGAADSGTTTTLVDAARTEADDFWNGKMLTLTSGSMNGDQFFITDFDAATDTLTFTPAASQAITNEQYEIDRLPPANVVVWKGATVNDLIAGRVDSSTGAMAANVMTAAAAAADLTTELQAGLSTLDAAGVRTAVGLASANLDTQLGAIDDFLDTEVAAIKTKTDSLTFTIAGQADVNIKSVNDVTVTGTGASGDEWGP